MLGHPRPVRRTASRMSSAPPPYIGARITRAPSILMDRSPSRYSATSGATKNSPIAGATRLSREFDIRLMYTLSNCPVQLGCCLLLRLVAFYVVAVGCGGVGRGFGLRGFFGGAKVAGAVVAAVFDVVVLGQGGNHGCAPGDLADVVEDDFRAAVVEFDRAFNFDQAARQAADVADIFQITGEDHHRERARHVIFAEVEEMNAARANLDAEHFSRDAPGFADVLARFVDRDAIGGEQWWSRQEQQFEWGFRCVAALHALILGCRRTKPVTGRKKCAQPSQNGTDLAPRARLAHTFSNHCTNCPPGRQAGIAAAVTTILLVPLVGAFGSGGAKATTVGASGPTVVQLTTYG